MAKAKEATPEQVAAMKRAANRLHHVTMRYVAAIKELADCNPIAFIPQTHPGLHPCRDFLDIILLVRAEVNGLAQLLIRAGVLTGEEVVRQFTYEYDVFAKAKAAHYGFEVNDAGLVYNLDKKEGQGGDQPKGQG
jgi:hypothetical protein